jgi:hypothetical protein
MLKTNTRIKTLRKARHLSPNPKHYGRIFNLNDLTSRVNRFSEHKEKREALPHRFEIGF